MTLNTTLCSPRLLTILSKYDLKPIFIWENFDNLKVKKEMIQKLEPIAGIYLIINLINGEKYVGLATPTNMYLRFKSHFYLDTGSKEVKSAVNKYNLTNFAFLVIDRIPNYNFNDLKDLLKLEKSYMIELNSEYNIQKPRWELDLYFEWNTNIFLKSINLICSIREFLWGRYIKRFPYKNINKHKKYTHLVKTELYSVSRLNAKIGESSIIRTIPKLAIYCNCHEITIRQALKFNGIVNNTWIIHKVSYY